MSTFFGGNFTQLKSEYSWDPRTGLQVTKRWRGTEAQILTHANAAILLGLRYDVRELSQGGYQEIDVYYGATETADPDVPLADIWSLDANENEKSLWTLDSFLTTFAGKSPQEIAELRREVEAYLDGQPSPSTGEIKSLTDVLTGLTPGEATVIQGIIRAISSGVEVKPISQPVVRRSLVVTFNTNLRPSGVGVDKIISAANFIGGGDPGGRPPGSILFAIRDGWYRKRHPTVEQISATNWQIVQEWWWLGEEYDAYTWETYGS